MSGTSTTLLGAPESTHRIIAFPTSFSMPIRGRILDGTNRDAVARGLPGCRSRSPLLAIERTPGCPELASPGVVGPRDGARVPNDDALSSDTPGSA
jgi:hypothetical protein